MDPGRRGGPPAERRAGHPLGAGRSGSAQSAAPVRSALLGGGGRDHVIVTSLTFASSLNALVSQPPLYGWNWDYALLAGFSAAENLPAARDDRTARPRSRRGPLGRRLLRDRRDLDGQSVPVLAMQPGAAVGPLHALRSPARGAVTDRARAGDPGVRCTHTSAALSSRRRGRSHQGRLRVVGTATLPTIGGSGQPVLEMGTGAVMATSLFSATDLNQQGSPVPGPMAVFVAVRPA